MRLLILLILGLAILGLGCKVAPSPAPAAESPVKAWRSPVLPQLAGVRVRIGNSWLDLFEPPTIEQAMLQAGGTLQAELDEAKSTVVTRENGRKILVRRSSYATFMLKNGDTLYVPRSQ
jgi:hypothetical protein